MVALLVVLTVLGCIAVDLAIKRREKASARLVREPAALFPALTAQELPGGLFVHGGHTWAKLDPSGAVQVGLDGFSGEQGILGRVDRFELPPDGATVRQGEPAFAALQGEADRVRLPRRRRGLRGERADQRRPGGGAEGALREGMGVHAPAVRTSRGT